MITYSVNYVILFINKLVKVTGVQFLATLEKCGKDTRDLVSVFTRV